MNKKTSEIKQILTLAYENHRKGNLKLSEVMTIMIAYHQSGFNQLFDHLITLVV